MKRGLAGCKTAADFLARTQKWAAVLGNRTGGTKPDRPARPQGGARRSDDGWGKRLYEICACFRCIYRLTNVSFLTHFGCNDCNTKKLQARFYETSAGRKPVREWLMELTPEDRRTVGHDVETVEFGWPIGMPTCRPLGSGLWEVRSNLRQSTIGRIIFCIVKGDMVLLHGFMKTTQQTPLRDIELADKRRKEIE